MLLPGLAHCTTERCQTFQLRDTTFLLRCRVQREQRATGKRHSNLFGTCHNTPRLLQVDPCLSVYRAGNSSAASVLGSLSCLMQQLGFGPPLRRIFLVEGIFPLELAWVLTAFPQNSFGWEHKPRSSLCTHAFHRTDSKDPDIHVLNGWVLATKTQPAHTIHKDRMWLPHWFDLKTVTYAKILPKMMNPGDITGERRRRREDPCYCSLSGNKEECPALSYSKQEQPSVKALPWTGQKFGQAPL